MALDVRARLLVKAMLVTRRILSLIVVVATGAAQAIATACPMGTVDSGDHPVARFGSAHVAAHGDHDAPAPSHAAHVPGAGVAEDGASRASAPLAHVPHEGSGECALTMSCAPLIPAPNVTLANLGWAADIILTSAPRHLVSADTNAATPPPRLLV